MPLGTPYHSFALPYPIRVDNFTDTIDDLPPPYNRPRLHLLTHTHSDHIAGLASRTFAYRVICSPDAKEMLLRHEVYTERSLYDHEYRSERKKTFGHLKVDPYVMPNGQKIFTGSKDLLHAIPLNMPTEFDISDSETVTITLIDANHCPGSVMFLIEGRRGTILHTGDLRAEPWFLSSIQRNHFLQPYLASSSEDLQIFVARREGTHPEATGLVKTLEAIYLDTACLLSPIVVPTKECAVRGVVGLVALFPSDTYFFINAWTWGYEDVLKGISHAFRCKIHFDRYKHSIYSHGSDPFLRAIGTRDAASTRFHACERFDRCSFVDVPSYDYATKGAVAPPSSEGKRVVYVNAVNMSCSSWEDYQASIKRRVSRGENVDSLLVPLSRHSPLPELMNFVALFRPFRVVPNTLDPALNGLDWRAMSRMFSGCLSSISSLGFLESVMAPPCSLTSHPSVTGPPRSFAQYSHRALSAAGEEYTDTAYSNLIGPGDAAEQWGEKGGKVRMKVLRTWIDAGRWKGFGTTRRVDQAEDEYSRLASSPRVASSALLRHVRSDDSSDEGGSEDHMRAAWMLFGRGEMADACETWGSSPPQSQSQVRAVAAKDVGMLLTPTSSPLLQKRPEGSSGEKQRSPGQRDLSLATPLGPSLGRVPTEIVLPVTHDRSRLTPPFKDVQTSETPQGMNETHVPNSQPFSSLDNIVPSESSKGTVLAPHSTQHLGSSGINLSHPQNVGSAGRKRETDDIGEASPVKRQRIGQERSNINMDKEGDTHQLNNGKPIQSRSMGPMTTVKRLGTRESQCKPSISLIRTSTVTGIDEREVPLTPTSSMLKVVDVSGVVSRGSPGLAVTPSTLLFPVRKCIEDRTLHTKTAPRTALSCSPVGIGQRLATCSTSVVIQPSVPTVQRASTVVRAKTLSIPIGAAPGDASGVTGGEPVSPRTAARRAERAERRRITEKLKLARPDLVLSGGRGKIQELERTAASAVPVASMSATASTSVLGCGTDMAKRGPGTGDRPGATEEGDKMDWEKSRLLTERVRETLKRGRRVSEVLPRLRCLEQWHAELM